MAGADCLYLRGFGMVGRVEFAERGRVGWNGMVGGLVLCVSTFGVGFGLERLIWV